MNPGQQDYKQLLTQVIKKQLAILGPAITLSKARAIPGLIIADDGMVTDISGNPQEITQKLIDQFVQLSGEIVRKTMEPLLTLSQPTPNALPLPTPSAAMPAVQNAIPTPNTVPTINPLPPLPVQQPLAQGQNPVQ